MKKGTVIKHPTADWGKGIVLENAFNRLVKELAASSKSNEETIYSQVKKKVF